ncbi:MULTISPECIES: hypothetical protein [Burkholderia]|uniref:hypothetical protein n=1 Tax=Burkholderia TaxID=32008 RepID=UPI001269B678|nr:MULTISPECIES: hypothetical protein [Burkholderia]
MDFLEFSFAESLESNDHEVRPLATGIDILNTLGPDCLGLDPPEFFGQPALRAGGEFLIGRCSCGVIGCGDQLADVEVFSDQVVWHLAQGHRIVFKKEQYEAALAQGAASTHWESPERTAERLVSCLDFSSRNERGYVFQWASTRIKRGQVTLLFGEGERQVMIDVGWNRRDPEDARNSVLAWIAADV